MRTFRLDGGCAEAVDLTPETLDIGGQRIAGWRAPAQAAWLACLVELTPDGEGSAERAVTACLGERLVTVGEDGGLALRLARRANGELVELNDEDWRTLPLFESPAHRVEAGDLAAAANG